MHCRLPGLALVLALGCTPTQTDPVTKDTYRSPLGNDFASQDAWVKSNHITAMRIAQDGGLLAEPEIEAACQEIFRQVVAAVPADHRRDFRYTLYLSASAELNAYTYGAGRVHCHLGLVARCRDAAEFAGIIAHEVGHNSHDHIGQSLGKATVADNILSLGGIAGRPGRILGYSIGGFVAGFALVQHTRKQEREADDRAVDYVAAAGLDPDGTARFFEALERDFGKDLRQGPQLFQSHPYPKNRVVRIRQRIGERHPGVSGARSTAAFDRAAKRAREVLPFYVALDQALGGDDIERIEKAAERGIAALPEHPQFHFWKGIALVAAEKTEAALPFLRRAAALDRTNFLTALVHASIELGEGNFPPAEQSASTVIRLMPPLPNGYFIRGVARLGLGRKQEAFADFDATLERLPKRRDREELIEEIRKVAPEYRR